MPATRWQARRRRDRTVVEIVDEIFRNYPPPPPPPTHLVEDEDKLALERLCDIFVEGGREVQRGVAGVDHQQDHIRNFQHAPHLPPRLEIVLKEADVAAVLVGNLAQTSATTHQHV